MSRQVNFSAGPSTLPYDVLLEAQAEFVDYHDGGVSLIEMSHRSPEYEAVQGSALELAKDLLGVPEDFDVLVLQGGATLQFAMVPMNLLHAGASGAYVDSGSWASKAVADASHHGETYAAWSGAEGGYTAMPSPDEVEVRPGTRYLHVTSNETIGGIQMTQWPDVEVPLVGDMSSDYMSRSIPWDRFDIVYGGAQKNMGPAGATLVFVRRSILEETNRDLASYLRYDIHAAKGSMYNTPPVFAVYMMSKVLEWVKAQGGLPAMEERAAIRSALVYGAIDASDGYYRSPVDAASRSEMNVVFRLPSEDLEAQFVSEASEAGMANLKGHRDVGGIRASLYNAMPIEGVELLAGFMSDFRRANAG